MSKHTEPDSAEVEEWLFDSVVGYLASPVFHNPIEHFLEQNCSIFSPDNTTMTGATGTDSDEETFIPGMVLWFVLINRFP